MVSLTQDDSVLIEETLSDIEDQEMDKPYTNYEILVYPADFTLEVLHDKWNSKTLRVPDFQRNYIWSKSKASRLIESFLLGLPVPSVFLYTERYSKHQLVIDGQQRLLSVFYYLNGKFADGSDFRLTPNIQRPWGGRAFMDLDEGDRLNLTDSVLRATVVRQLHPQDDTSIFHIFERLNTGNTPLSAQEIRNCIYRGPFNDALKRFNESDEAWRAIMGSPKPSSRQQDVELALRMISLYDRQDRYQKPMKDFLNSMMNDHRNSTQKSLDEWEKLFSATSKNIVHCLGEKPFHIRSGLNRAVFDSVAVAFARNPDRIPSDIQERYACLIEDPDFQRSINSSTTDVSNVHGRIAAAERILFGS